MVNNGRERAVGERGGGVGGRWWWWEGWWAWSAHANMGTLANVTRKFPMNNFHQAMFMPASSDIDRPVDYNNPSVAVVVVVDVVVVVVENGEPEPSSPASVYRSRPAESICH